MTTSQIRDGRGASDHLDRGFVDPAAGFTRRAVSPPARDLTGEALDFTLGPGARLAYEAPPRPGMEYLYLLEGALDSTADGCAYALEPGDCLRYRPQRASAFASDADARFVLFLV